jgi:hypothetical protein
MTPAALTRTYVDADAGPGQRRRAEQAVAGPGQSKVEGEG